MRGLRLVADLRNPASLANRMRERRFRIVERMIDTLDRPIRVLDVGGTPEFWIARGYAQRSDVEIVLYNIERFPSELPNMTSVVGDAVDLSEFNTGAFEVVFSNSVIEHLETYERQRRMAREVMRVGRRYVVQTPNFWFPLEPHFLVPGFQFMPVRARVALLRSFSLGHYPRTADRVEAERAVRLIRLMTRRELEQVFPGGRIWVEHLWGLAKSYMVYGGQGMGPVQLAAFQ